MSAEVEVRNTQAVPSSVESPSEEVSGTKLDLSFDPLLLLPGGEDTHRLKGREDMGQIMAVFSGPWCL